MGLSLIRHEHLYQAVKEEHENHNYPVAALCKLANVSRAAYYKWLHREIPKSEQKNRFIVEKIITVITRLKMGCFNFPNSANYGIK
ncbi:MAG: hypothetical protein E6731_18280 [Lachnospiraceae bacterium]|nr:hypothetical protein [Lachnospiraceae bacterium]